MKSFLRFFECSRFFDAVDRQKLRRNHYEFGLSSMVLRWFELYQCHRSKCVKWNEMVSSALHINYGVPQGTVIGTLFFTLFTNDIVSIIKLGIMKLFANNSMIYIRGNNLNQISGINTDREL